jgi:hypothetical protein
MASFEAFLALVVALAQTLRRTYEQRRDSYEARLRRRQLRHAGSDVATYHDLLDAMLARERKALQHMRHSGEIGAELHQKLLREVDLMAAQHQEHH